MPHRFLISVCAAAALVFAFGPPLARRIRFRMASPGSVFRTRAATARSTFPKSYKPGTQDAAADHAARLFRLGRQPALAVRARRRARLHRHHAGIARHHVGQGSARIRSGRALHRRRLSSRRQHRQHRFRSRRTRRAVRRRRLCADDGARLRRHVQSFDRPRRRRIDRADSTTRASRRSSSRTASRIRRCRSTSAGARTSRC